MRPSNSTTDTCRSPTLFTSSISNHLLFALTRLSPHYLVQHILSTTSPLIMASSSSLATSAVSTSAVATHNRLPITLLGLPPPVWGNQPLPAGGQPPLAGAHAPPVVSQPPNPGIQPPPAPAIALVQAEVRVLDRKMDQLIAALSGILPSSAGTTSYAMGGHHTSMVLFCLPPHSVALLLEHTIYH